MNPALYISPKFSTGIFLPDWLLEMDLSHGAMLCYARLARLARKRGYAYAGRQSLGKFLGVSNAQVSAYMKELTKKKLVKVERTGRASHYFLLVHSAMVITDEQMRSAEKRYANDEPDDVTSEVSLQTTDVKLVDFSGRDSRSLYNDTEKLNKEDKKDPDSRQGVFLEWWCKTYYTFFHEQYRITGKDKDHLRRLLSQNIQVHRIQEVATSLLKTTDRWYRDNRTITTLCSRWNELSILGMEPDYFQGRSAYSE
jgi:predicted transcriptional regulator